MLNQSEHLLIIGAGIVGLCAAYALQKEGYQITIVDPDNASERATTASACLIGGSAVIPWATRTLWYEIPGMLSNPERPLTLSLPFPYDLLSSFLKCHAAGKNPVRERSSEGLAELGLSGFDQWMSLLKELPDAAQLFVANGCYLLYTSLEQKQADLGNCEVRRRRGMVLKDYSANDLYTSVPKLATPGATATNVVGAAHLRDPARLQRILKTAIENNGGTFITGWATDFITTNRRVTSVIAGKHRYPAGTVVVAAGYGSKALLKKLNSAIPLLPCRGFSITLPNADVSIDRPLLVQKYGYAVTPIDTGLRIAGLVSIGGNQQRQTAKATKRLLAHAESVFGELDRTGLRINSGIRPLTPDSLPVIDRSPHFENLYFNFGHGHWGLTQAASSASLLVSLLQSKAVSDFRFGANRFQ